MIYYTIYLKQLNNDTGYIDIGLEDEQLFKDFITFLDIGLKSHKIYRVASPATPDGSSGQFAIDLTTIAAITTAPPTGHRPGSRPFVAKKT
jgi:hypothetical protein